MTPNERTVTLKLKRIDVCNLILAMSVMTEDVPTAEKWKELRAKLKDILDAHDSKQND